MNFLTTLASFAAQAEAFYVANKPTIDQAVADVAAIVSAVRAQVAPPAK